MCSHVFWIRSWLQIMGNETLHLPSVYLFVHPENNTILFSVPWLLSGHKQGWKRLLPQALWRGWGAATPKHKEKASGGALRGCSSAETLDTFRPEQQSGEQQVETETKEVWHSRLLQHPLYAEIQIFPVSSCEGRPKKGDIWGQSFATRKWTSDVKSAQEECISGESAGRCYCKHSRPFIMPWASRLTPILIGSRLTNPLTAPLKQ